MNSEEAATIWELEEGRSDSLTLPSQPLILALSGGGIRAALFHLGILVYLQKLDRLKNIREVIAVSGGSILAAHFLKHWSKVSGRDCDFTEVASEFLKICLSDIRNSVFVPWVWSRFLPWCWFMRSKGRTGRLLAEYHRIFGETTLGDLDDNCPSIAFVATDGRHQQRVAFTATQILRWSFATNQDSTPAPILSQGVKLSLAVAASSCFPPVFPRLHLKHADLGITYREFKEELYLNDGGVVTNLGIEVLIALRKRGWTEEMLILIADAERSLAVKPGNFPLADVDATLAALGKAAREAAQLEFGSSAILVPFADRVQNKDGLPFRVQTAMFNYRTDLDCPTWQEMHGLMIHGAMVAKQATQGRFGTVSADDVRKLIATIIAEAGGPQNLQLPTEDDFRGSGQRSYTRIVWHVISATMLVLLLLGGLTYGFLRLIWPAKAYATVVSQPFATASSKEFDDELKIIKKMQETDIANLFGKFEWARSDLQQMHAVRIEIQDFAKRSSNVSIMDSVLRVSREETVIYAKNLVIDSWVHELIYKRGFKNANELTSQDVIGALKTSTSSELHELVAYAKETRDECNFFQQKARNFRVVGGPEFEYLDDNPDVEYRVSYSLCIASAALMLLDELDYSQFENELLRAQRTHIDKWGAVNVWNSPLISHWIEEKKPVLFK